MSRRLVAALVAVIGAAGCQDIGGEGMPGDAGADAGATCRKDTDCKGARICEDGQCVEPPGKDAATSDGGAPADGGGPRSDGAAPLADGATRADAATVTDSATPADGAASVDGAAPVADLGPGDAATADAADAGPGDATTADAASGGDAGAVDAGPGDAATADAAPGGDAGAVDAGDASEPPADAAEADACPPPAFELCDGADNDCDGEVDEGDPGGGRDCDTGTPGVCAIGVSVCREGVLECQPLVAPAAEVCDGRDNDCNGLTDELPVLAGPAVRVTQTPFHARAPDLAWNGAGYGIAWSGIPAAGIAPDVFLRRVDAAGAPVGDPLRLSDDNADSKGARLALAGGRYFTTWIDSRGDNMQKALMARASADAVRQGEDVGLSGSTASGTDAAPLGDQAAFAWIVGDTVWTSRYHADGQLAVGARGAAGAQYGQYPAVAAGPDGELGVAWRDGRTLDRGNPVYQIYFARIGPDGAQIGQTVAVSGNGRDVQPPAIAWSGDRWGIVWSDTRSGRAEVYFAAVDAAPALVAGPSLVSEHASSKGGLAPAADGIAPPAIAWNGRTFGVAWWDDRDGSTEIYFAHLNRDGVNGSGDRRISDAPGMSVFPQLVWTGTEFGVVWQDHRDGHAQVYFVHGPMGCP